MKPNPMPAVNHPHLKQRLHGLSSRVLLLRIRDNAVAKREDRIHIWRRDPEAFSSARTDAVEPAAPAESLRVRKQTSEEGKSS